MALLIAAVCAVLSFTPFSGKKSPQVNDMQFFLQNVQNEIFKILKMFKNNMKFTRSACQINSKISNRLKHHAYNILILSLLLVIIMV